MPTGPMPNNGNPMLLAAPQQLQPPPLSPAVGAVPPRPASLPLALPPAPPQLAPLPQPASAGRVSRVLSIAPAVRPVRKWQARAAPIAVAVVVAAAGEQPTHTSTPHESTTLLPFMNSISRYSVWFHASSLTCCLCASALFYLLSQPVAAAPRTFNSPEDAVRALSTAVNTRDINALGDILGPSINDLRSPDPVQARNELTTFAA